MKELTYGLLFAVAFAVAAAVAGFMYGYWSGLEYERATGYSGGNAPAVFILTTPVGVVLGLVFGVWLANKENRRR